MSFQSANNDVVPYEQQMRQGRFSGKIEKANKRGKPKSRFLRWCEAKYLKGITVDDLSVDEQRALGFFVPTPFALGQQPQIEAPSVSAGYGAPSPYGQPYVPPTALAGAGALGTPPSAPSSFDRRFMMSQEDYQQPANQVEEAVIVPEGEIAPDEVLVFDESMPITQEMATVSASSSFGQAQPLGTTSPLAPSAKVHYPETVQSWPYDFYANRQFENISAQPATNYGVQNDANSYAARYLSDNNGSPQFEERG